jgi:hypothetical protein
VQRSVFYSGQPKKPAPMRLFFIFFVILLTAGACNKSSSNNFKSFPDTLQGKWRYVEYYASSGGPGSWYPVSPVNQWIEFKQNGIVSSNIESFKDADSYQLPDSNTIKFIIPSKPDGFLLFRYNIDTLQAALILSPLHPLCIEGCAIKFKR